MVHNCSLMIRNSGEWLEMVHYGVERCKKMMGNLVESCDEWCGMVQIGEERCQMVPNSWEW